jgi:hypothetical protein
MEFYPTAEYDHAVIGWKAAEPRQEREIKCLEVRSNAPLSARLAGLAIIGGVWGRGGTVVQSLVEFA